MPHYKAPDNSLHFIEVEFAHLLPAGCVEITDEEAEALRPLPVTPPVVYTCSPWQIRKALNLANLRQPVEDAVAASTDIALKDGWEFATEFRSDDPFVITFGAMLGKSEEETGQFILLASQL
jgi:hypothetical protein